MSNLLKASLALRNQQLKDRVHSAVIQTAHQQEGADGASGQYAHLVLSDLTRHWEDFLLEVVMNQDVQAVIVISDDNNFILARNVEDTQIVGIVNGVWGLVADRLFPQPDEEEEDPVDGDD